MSVYFSAIIAATFLFSATLQAQTRCVEVFRISNEELSPEVLQQELLDMQNIWENSVVSHLKSPTVDLFLEADNVASSYFLHAKFEIHLGLLHGAELAPFQARGVAFGHEFGHALFAENFSFTWGGKRVTFKEVVEESQSDIVRAKKDPELIARFSEMNEIQQTIKLAKESGHDTIQKQMEQLLKEKKRQLRKLVPLMARFDIISELTTSLNELFADSLPVLFWRDPQIMSQVIAPENANSVAAVRDYLEHRGKNPNATSQPREFKTTSFKNWKREVKDAYTRMDPVRGALWNLYMKNLKDTEIGLFMKVFLNATDQYVSSNLSRYEVDDLKDRNPAELNREFLRFFVQEARDQGLPIRKEQ